MVDNLPDELQWFREEAARFGIELTDDDLKAVSPQVTRVKAYLAAHPLPERDSVEPCYHFAVPRGPKTRRRP